MKWATLLMLLLIPIGTLQAMQQEGIPEQATEKTESTSLIFIKENEKTKETEIIAEIPIEIAKELSSVFKAQLEGEWEKDKNIIAIDKDDKFNTDTVKLFAKMVEAKITSLKAPKRQDLIEKGLITWLIQQNKSSLISLYYFLDKYMITEFMSYLANPLIQFIAENLYQQEEPIFEESPLLQNLVKTLCLTHMLKEPILTINNVNDFDVSNNGRYIAISSYDDTLTAEDTKRNRAQIHDLVKGTTQTFNYVYKAQPKFSPQGTYITTTAKALTQLYNTSTNKVIGNFSNVRNVSFSADERYIVTDSFDGKVTIYDLQKDTSDTITYPNSVVAKISPDGSFIIILADNKEVQIYDRATKKITNSLKLDKPAYSIMLSPNNRYIAILFGMNAQQGDGTLQVYDIQDQKIVATIQHNKGINAATFSQDSRYILSTSKDKTIKIYDLQQMKEYPITLNKSAVSADFSPDGNYITAISNDGTVILYDMQTKKIIAYINHPSWGKSVKFNPDGDSFIVLSQNTLYVYPSCDRPIKDMVAFFILMQMKKDVKLNQSSWLYQTFMQLPEQERNHLMGKYPHIKTIMDNSIAQSEEITSR